MNKKNSHIIDELLVKYLLGEASGEEQSKVQQWINNSSDNKKYFEHFELIWNQSKKLQAQSEVSVDDAWTRFLQRTREDKPAPKVIEMPAATGSRPNWMRAAAAIVALAGMAGLLYYFIGTGRPEMIAVHADNAPVTRTLPDGSVVTLNKYAAITYPEKFNGDTRMVTLEGEAFFNVAPNKQQPFIIRADEAKITVVGTSFNVKSSDEKTEVIVETGVVAVAKKDHEVRLNPNEKATVLKNRLEPVKTTIDDELYNYYRTKEFVCNGTPLWRLADVLSEAYGVTIQVSPRVRSLPLTATFSDESLDDILSVIGETFNIEVERQGNTISFK